MKINILGYTVAITIEKSDLLDRVEKLAKTYRAYGQNEFVTLVCRVKAYRHLTNAGLKESKDWVESHFAD